jgi:hypothetical protein
LAGALRAVVRRRVVVRFGAAAALLPVPALGVAEVVVLAVLVVSAIVISLSLLSPA